MSLYVQVCSPDLDNWRTGFDVFGQTCRSMGNRWKDVGSEELFLMGSCQWLKVICAEFAVCKFYGFLHVRSCKGDMDCWIRDSP